jgi:hypothetical protein
LQAWSALSLSVAKKKAPPSQHCPQIDESDNDKTTASKSAGPTSKTTMNTPPTQHHPPCGSAPTSTLKALSTPPLKCKSRRTATANNDDNKEEDNNKEENDFVSGPRQRPTLQEIPESDDDDGAEDNDIDSGPTTQFEPKKQGGRKWGHIPIAAEEWFHRHDNKYCWLLNMFPHRRNKKQWKGISGFYPLSIPHVQGKPRFQAWHFQDE